MNAKEFLQRILPTTGRSYFGAIVANQRFSQHKLRNIDALVSYADRCKRKKCDVYFATGSFGQQRTTDDCEYKRTLYLDIDCGPGKPYADKKTAITALCSFCDTHFIRPNVLVDSGGGIHAYWTFKNDITLEAWLPMASALKELCTIHGFGADPTVTADAARILRIPGTFNQKGDTPQQVRVIHATTNEFSPDKLATLLGTKKSQALTALAALANEQDLEFTSAYGSTPFFAQRIIERCGVLKHSYDTGGAGQVEPLWMAQLSLLAYAVDGNEYIHTISEGHKGYDYQRTEKKFAQRLATKESGKYGPPLCKTLGMYLPEKCKACRFSGRIKSPIVLGREEDGAELPFPYKQDDKAIYKMEKVESDDGEVAEKIVKVLSYPIENFQLFHSPDKISGMVYQFDMLNGTTTCRVEFTKQQMVDKRQLIVQLSNCGVPLLPDEYLEFVRLMSHWAKKMQAAKQIGQPTSALGWTEHDKKPAFTLINCTICSSGSDKEVTFLDKEFVKDFTPKGNREAWIKIAHYLTAEDRHAVTAGILSAFAAPLISFTGVNGCVFALVSDKSGTGKSTALRTAQAVWGDPRRGVNALDDTPLSVANRMGKLNNLPAFWDELRMKEQVKQFVILMFQVSQGKERSRLTPGIQTRHVGTWNTLITVASNESITDHVRHLVHGTDAGLLRVFEVTVPDLDRKSNIDTDSAALDKNYGHIGREYAQYLVDNYDTVQSLLIQVRDKFSAKVNAGSDERFWLATCTCLLTGGIIANKLGFTTININGFFNWLAVEYLRSRDEQVIEYDPIDIRAMKLVGQFLDIHKDQLVVFERLSGKKTKKNVGVLQSLIPKGEILGVIATEDKMIRIKKVALTKWAYDEHSQAQTQLLKELTKQGCVLGKRSITTGVPNVIHTRCDTIDIPMKDMELSNFITE